VGISAFVLAFGLARALSVHGIGASSGRGAYRAVFDRVVGQALDAFAPQLVLVSSGFDASFFDPLVQQMCTSEDYR
jgi:acetoin utilization deacetylase AcuC-like enzyme